MTAEVMAVEADQGYSVESVCGVEPDVPIESERVETLFFSPTSVLGKCCWVDAECECEWDSDRWRLLLAAGTGIDLGTSGAMSCSTRDLALFVPASAGLNKSSAATLGR